jgi:hypothetical protein
MSVERLWGSTRRRGRRQGRCDGIPQVERYPRSLLIDSIYHKACDVLVALMAVVKQDPPKPVTNQTFSRLKKHALDRVG